MHPTARATLLCVATLAAAWVAPLATAQDHEHDAAGPILLAHDGPADGRQFVGNLAHFVAIVHGDDAVPDFHQDVPVRVWLNDRILFETTPDSGHDYDGVNAFDIVFPETGPYRVEALGADGKPADTFAGEVLPAPDLQVSMGSSEQFEILAGVPVSYTYEVSDGGALVAHSDCWVELLQADKTLLRTKTHTHEEPQEVTLTFPAAGTYTLRRTCFQAYPSLKATLFVPHVVEQSIGVGAGPPLAVGTQVNDGAQATPPTAQNAVVQGAAGGELLLIGTFDPYTIVGPDTLQHLMVLAVDPSTGAPRQHVDFTASLSGPAGGVLFASDTLHEYDGVYELATRQAVPGPYTLVVTADAGDWSDQVILQWLVAPAAVPTSAGTVGFNLASHGRNAHNAADYELTATAQTGPFAHSEVELQILGDGPVPLLRAKLHTHDDGAFPFRLELPEGTYDFAFDAFPLMPEAVFVEPVHYAVDVGPPVGVALDSGEAGQAAPALPTVWLAGILVLAAALRRRP